MCVYSMVVDHYFDKWQPYISPPIVPWQPIPTVVPPWQPPDVVTVPPPRMPTDGEIQEFGKLLERAREYDKKHNQPDCELEEKKKKLLKLAKKLGIEEKVSFLDDK